MSGFEKNNSTSFNFENRRTAPKFARTETVRPVVEGGLPLRNIRFKPHEASKASHFFGTAQGTPGSKHEKNTTLYKIRKPLQVLTLGTTELLLSATAVTAGGVIAGGYLHYPLSALLNNSLTLSSPSLTLSVAGLAAIVLGLKYGRRTVRKIRSAL